MPHYEELYPGRFLKGVTLMQPKVIRIVSIGNDQLEGDNGKETKAIIRYKDKNGEGEFVCCKTNSALIGAIHGPDYTKWPGKLVTIHFDASVPFGSEKPGGIRVCGSPDLKETLRVEIKRPRRKKPEIHILQPTRTAGTDALKKDETPASPEQILIWQSHLQEPTDMPTLTTAWDHVRAQPMAKAQLDDLSRLFMARSTELRGQRA